MKLITLSIVLVAALAALALGLVSAVAIPTAQASSAAAPVEVPDVAKDPREVPPPIRRTKTAVVTVNLVAKEVLAEIAPGQKFWFWTFAEADGSGKQIGKATVPGPMIRAMQGDTIVINLKNDPDNVEPHNIDLHAVMGPGGGAAVTNVEPGETKTLQFKAMRAGAYIYHCAGEGMAWEHVAHGMYGLIMIEPPGGLPPVDKEFYVGQSDWYTVANASSPDPIAWLAPDVLNVSEEKAFLEHPDLFTLNGHLNALTSTNLFGEAMSVMQGQKVRIFFVTGGPNVGSNFHIIGQIFDKAYSGRLSTAGKDEETVYVAPGSSSVFEFQALVPGQYLLVDHALYRVPRGALGYLHVHPTVAPTIDMMTGAVLDPGSWPLDIFSPVATGSGH